MDIEGLWVGIEKLWWKSSILLQQPVLTESERQKSRVQILKEKDLFNLRVWSKEYVEHLEHMKLKCVLTKMFVLQPERRQDLSILQQYGSEGRGKEEGG